MNILLFACLILCCNQSISAATADDPRIKVVFNASYCIVNAKESFFEPDLYRASFFAHDGKLLCAGEWPYHPDDAQLLLDPCAKKPQATYGELQYWPSFVEDGVEFPGWWGIVFYDKHHQEIARYCYDREKHEIVVVAEGKAVRYAYWWHEPSTIDCKFPLDLHLLKSVTEEPLESYARRHSY